MGIATLTSCFVNSNRDPKSEAAKPSDFFYFTPTEDEGASINSDAANAFFALADAGLLPGWVVAIAPIDKLAKSRNSEEIVNPVVWVGEGLVLIMPVVDDNLVRFPMGFVDTSGEVATSGGVVRVPEIGNAWILDGEMAISS